MNYKVERVSEDAETRQHVLILKSTSDEDRLALNVQEKEAVVLTSLLSDDGMPGQNILEHLRDTASRDAGSVQAIKLLLIDTHDGAVLTPILIMQREDSLEEHAMPASLAHATAWSVALNLPFEIDDELVAELQSTVTIIPGEAPSGFRDFLSELDDIDKI